jgi:hypothetical protein
MLPCKYTFSVFLIGIWFLTVLHDSLSMEDIVFNSHPDCKEHEIISMLANFSPDANNIDVIENMGSSDGKIPSSITIIFRGIDKFGFSIPSELDHRAPIEKFMKSCTIDDTITIEFTKFQSLCLHYANCCKNTEFKEWFLKINDFQKINDWNSVNKIKLINYINFTECLAYSITYKLKNEDEPNTEENDKDEDNDFDEKIIDITLSDDPQQIEINKLKIELEDTKKEIEKLSKTASKSDDQVQDLQKQLTNANGAKKTNQMAQTFEINSPKNEIEALKSQLQTEKNLGSINTNLRAELDAKKRELDRVQNERITILKKITSLTNELKTIEKNAHIINHEKSHIYKLGLADKQKELQDLLNRKDQDITDLRTALEKEQTKNSNLTLENVTVQLSLKTEQTKNSKILFTKRSLVELFFVLVTCVAMYNQKLILPLMQSCMQFSF